MKGSPGFQLGTARLNCAILIRVQKWIGKIVKIRPKNARAIAKMRDAGRLVAECFALLHDSVQPGVPLIVLDKMVEDFIAKQGAEPLYKGYQGSSSEHPPFPG